MVLLLLCRLLLRCAETEINVFNLVMPQSPSMAQFTSTLWQHCQLHRQEDLLEWKYFTCGCPVDLGTVFKELWCVIWLSRPGMLYPVMHLGAALLWPIYK